MERMPLMGSAHQKRSEMRPDDGRGGLRSKPFRAFSLAGNEVTKGKCPLLLNDKVSADTLSTRAAEAPFVRPAACNLRPG